MTLLDKEPVKRVQKLLKEFNPNQDVITLDQSARTAKEAASSLGCEVGAIIKSLLFKTEKNFILCLVAGDKKASLNKIKKFLKLKNVFMAAAEDVKIITGYTIGGVSPIGHLSEVDIYIDNSLKRLLPGFILTLFSSIPPSIKIISCTFPSSIPAVYDLPSTVNALLFNPISFCCKCDFLEH